MKKHFYPALLVLLSFALPSSLKAQVTHLVISQVYGGGGNSGATYKNDYIELFNPTSSTITFTNWSVQYAGATSGSWAVTPISGSIDPGQYFLIQEAAGAGGTVDLVPDATGNIPLSATTGKVALVPSTTALSGTCPAAGSYIDLVGYSSTASCFEGSSYAPAPSNNTNAVKRGSSGCTDTDVNSADFTANTAASPRNTASALNVCPPCTPPTNQPTTLILTPDNNTINGSFTASVAGTTPAAKYLVLINTVNSFTAPTSGNSYTVGSTLGSATVVAAGTGTTFTASSLTPATTYYIQVYAYTASTCYNTTSPLSGSTTTTNNSATTVAVAAGSNAAEPNTNGTFSFTLSAAAPAGGVTLAYSFSGTATLSSDYSDPGSGSITIPEGSTTATLTLTTLNDALFEADETITLTINNATAPYTIATPSASITLSDDGDQSTISFTGTTYSQDFNTLATSSTSSTLPTGWALSESGSNANTTYGTDNGGSTTGNTYSYGTGTGSDRAFGGLRSGSLVPTVGAFFVNNTGSTISSLQVNYTGEQWRLGTTGRADRLDFQYSTTATSLSSGTWTDLDALDFSSPVSSGSAGALDGNSGANRTAITYTLTGLSIAPGGSFVFRWTDFDATGSDDGLGIDDFSIALGCTPPTNQPTSLSLTPALQSISGSFTAAAPGAVPATDYLVIVSTSNTLSQQPATGTVYATDDVIGNGRVVAAGTATSFTASNLSVNTSYYFFVYAYTATLQCYNLTSPLTGSASTTSPPPCTAPATGASNLSGTPTGSSIVLSYSRGDGSAILIVARPGSAVNDSPINSVSYTQGAEIGSGNFVIYNGTASSYNYTGLTQNTAYYFALYEYNSATNCYIAAPLTGSFTTTCSTPSNITSLSASSGNGGSLITWTNPTASCFDEVLVVLSTSSINGTGDTYVGSASTAYSGGTQVVYRGLGSNVSVTGLTNGTTYYVKVFTRLNGTYSSGVQTTITPFDPASGYLYLFGGLHSHSSYSDGNKDNTANTVDEDLAFARDALCVDFWGISEHNHSGAGMQLSDYALGFAEAAAVNGTGNNFVAMYGMEWGVISGGGHVLVYGFEDKLLGWEPGNYDIYVAKNDYASLWTTVNAQPGSFALLAHPSSSDYGGIATTYSATADAAVYGVAVESGPAFSTSTNYTDFASSLSYLSYYKTMLAKGYHLSPQMDQDNHNLTHGRANASRMVVLSSGRTRTAITDAIRSGRFYASEDCNAQVAYKLGSSYMGSSATGSGVPSLSLTVSDGDGETVDNIVLWGGEAGSGTVPPSGLKTYTAQSTITFSASDGENVQPDNTTYYYYAVITQADGNKIVTAPIWFTRNDAVLPVTFTSITAQWKGAVHSKVDVRWTTAQESNSRRFLLERSTDGVAWSTIGEVAAAGSSNTTRNYTYTDLSPLGGTNFYRVRQEDLDGKFLNSRVVSVSDNGAGKVLYSLYPTITKGATRLYSTSGIPERVTVQVVDAMGRQIRQQVAFVSKAAPLSLTLEGMAPGTYFIKVKGVTTSQHKVVKQ